jgi:hypothetical protein
MMKQEKNMLTTEDKASLYQFVKDYLEGSQRPDMSDSDFARGYQRGLASLQSLLASIEQAYQKKGA